MWRGPALLAGVLAVELIYLLVRGTPRPGAPAAISPQQVGTTLFGPYLVAVELASMLLLAGLVAAYHLGRRAH